MIVRNCCTGGEKGCAIITKRDRVFVFPSIASGKTPARRLGGCEIDDELENGEKLSDNEENIGDGEGY